MLRRNPDPKWRLLPEEYKSTLELQQNLLQTYVPMLKPGGRLVYSTCSVFPEENSGQVKRFLESEAGSQFELKQEFFNLPHLSPGDGFYAAALVFNKPN